MKQKSATMFFFMVFPFSASDCNLSFYHILNVLKTLKYIIRFESESATIKPVDENKFIWHSGLSGRYKAEVRNSMHLAALFVMMINESEIRLDTNFRGE